MIENKFPGKDISEDDIKNKFPLAAKKNEQHKSILNINGHQIGGNNLVIFAGPNMVESEKLIIQTAQSVKENGAHFLRGGAFKPLTFPYRSEKYNETREDGLKWLKKAKEETGIGIVTEIMEERYLDLICETADILQIGSRNMQNFPFLTACAKTQKPILLKRHYGASLRDWLGAAEYISDPSHATFWSPWVQSMTLASVAAGADGIMLEVHPDPKNAAVDPLQPIDFNEFKVLMEKVSKLKKAL